MSDVRSRLRGLVLICVRCLWCCRAYSNRGNVRSMLDRIEEALVDYR